MSILVIGSIEVAPCCSKTPVVAVAGVVAPPPRRQVEPDQQRQKNQHLHVFSTSLSRDGLEWIEGGPFGTGAAQHAGQHLGVERGGQRPQRLATTGADGSPRPSGAALLTARPCSGAWRCGAVVVG